MASGCDGGGENERVDRKRFKRAMITDVMPSYDFFTICEHTGSNAYKIY